MKIKYLFIMLVVFSLFISGCGTGETIKELKETTEEFEEGMEKLDDTLKINKKVDECAELCAGESKEIPAVLIECKSACYEVYYYGGETELDNFIEEYKNG